MNALADFLKAASTTAITHQIEIIASLLKKSGAHDLEKLFIKRFQSQSISMYKVLQPRNLDYLKTNFTRLI